MTPERWRQIDRVFQAAVELAPAERAAFINTACGDDDSLRREVEALLAADKQAGSLIETPAWEATLFSRRKKDSFRDNALWCVGNLAGGC